MLQMDPVGVVLLMGAVISFLLAFQYGGITYPFNSSTVIGLLVGFVVIMIVLVIWECFQREYAMLVPRLIRQRSLWAPATFQFFFAGTYFLLLYYLPIYFQSIRGASPIQSGVDNLPLIVTAGVFVLLGGITVSKTGHAAPFMALGAAVMTISIGLLYTLGINTPTRDWVGYQILVGAAASFPFQNCINIIHANVDASDVASVTSILYCTFRHRIIINFLNKSTNSNTRHRLSGSWRRVQRRSSAVGLRKQVDREPGYHSPRG